MSWEEDAYRYAIKNAYLHEGKAELKAVVGKVLALHKGEVDLKKIMPKLEKIVKEINELKFEDIKKEFEGFEGSYELKPREKEKDLPKLDWADKEKVVTRFAPNPNGPFHLGSARAAIVSYEFAKRYNGKFILRFDDTDPKVKKPIENAEQIFKTDLEWLGIKADETYFASDRLEVYYKHMQKLVDLGKAYVCICSSDVWREKIGKGDACECRELKVDEQKKRFEKMLKHEYKEGEAVLRVKTDLKHADPSIRDWWAAKIVDNPEHTRVGSKYHLWPSYNLASGVDDHELGVTLIVRGQEHEQNMTKQKYMYGYLGWEHPHAFHFGRIKLGDLVLSTSKIAKGIEDGIYDGWDDIQLGTIQALRRRGFDAMALRDAILELGVKSVDAAIEMKKLADLNKKYIEGKSERITFIQDPVYLDVQYAPKTVVEKDGKKYSLSGGIQRFIVSKGEAEEVKEGKTVRLRNTYNVRITSKDELQVMTDFVSTGMIKGTVLGWILRGVDTEVTMPDKSVVRGVVDEKIWGKKFQQILFLEKFGYARIDSLEQGLVKLWFTHE